jgi:hypothetical protein
MEKSWRPKKDGLSRPSGHCTVYAQQFSFFERVAWDLLFESVVVGLVPKRQSVLSDSTTFCILTLSRTFDCIELISSSTLGEIPFVVRRSSRILRVSRNIVLAFVQWNIG